VWEEIIQMQKKMKDIRNYEIATLSSKVSNDIIRDCRAHKAVLAMTEGWIKGIKY
jgi:hypothetical protein